MTGLSVLCEMFRRYLRMDVLKLTSRSCADLGYEPTGRWSVVVLHSNVRMRPFLWQWENGGGRNFGYPRQHDLALALR